MITDADRLRYSVQPADDVLSAQRVPLRDDGARQLTLAGSPLYTEAADRGDHNDLGAHGTDGTWFAVSPTGEHATTGT